MSNCIFCRLAAGELPSRKVYEDDLMLAIEDINPGAPIHLLLLPKRHIGGLEEATAADQLLLGDLQLRAAALARQLGLDRGYRTVFNVGEHAGQSVPHLHLHLLAGRPLAWPPG